MVKLGTAPTAGGESTIHHTRPRVPPPPPLRPRASLLPPVVRPHAPAFRVISFNVAAGSGSASLTPTATGVEINSPTFASSAFVMGVGTPESLAEWDLGYVQTITGHSLRSEYDHTNADYVVNTPIRDAADGTPEPWYHTHTPPSPGNALTRVTMDDTPWHSARWDDPRTGTPNSLIRSTRRLELTAWLIAQNRATPVPIYLKNVSWSINFTINVDRSRPIAARAVAAGPGMSAPIVGDGQGSLTPTLTGNTYNSVVNNHAVNPTLSVRGGSTSTALSRPALDGGAPSIRLNPAVAASPSTYSPRHIAVGCGAGAPLPPAVRLRLGRHFSADLSTVRVHTDARAQQAARNLSARAVTYGNQILLAPGERPTDLRLMAHEAAHVVQQGHAPVAQRGRESRSVSYEHEAHQAADAVVRQEPFTVQQRTSQPRIQRLGLSDILDGLAELAANLPGFTLLTVIIGRNPINLRRVERNFTNLLRGFMGLIPGGEILFQVLNRYGIVERLGNWVSDQVTALGINYDYLRGRFNAFTDSLGLSDLFNPSGVWQRATNIFSEPVNRIRSFVSRLITQAITWLKETFMQPLSNFCREIPGYTLVTVLLGRDPFTNAPVERSALNVVRGFAEFIPGGTEKVNQLVESRALQRAYEWFLQETQARNLTWARVTGTFAAAWSSLRLEDVLHPIDTLQRMVTMFRPLMADLVSFAGAALMKLLELIFEAVMGAGGARILAILKRGHDTFLTIIRNPVGFLGNLLRAVGQGVRQFMGNILTHLRTGVIAWLTGPVAAAGVQMPEQWDLRGIIWFVMQILGLTWPRIRQKLVRLMGERPVGMIEAGFQLLQEIRQRGLVQALRDRVTEFFGQLREAALGSIRSFIQERMVMAGIQQLLSLLSPVGAVIQAIIKTYTTIRFFIDKINQILDLVESIVNSVAAIASGSIGAAANFIERTMARTIPVILDFLARFIGLGDVGGQVQRTIQSLQARVDQMLDRAVDWIRNAARNFASRVLGGDPSAPSSERVANALREAVPVVNRFAGRPIGAAILRPLLVPIKIRHRLTSLTVVARGNIWLVDAAASPGQTAPTAAQVEPDTVSATALGQLLEPVLAVAERVFLSRYETTRDLDEMARALGGQREPRRHDVPRDPNVDDVLFAHSVRSGAAAVTSGYNLNFPSSRERFSAQFGPTTGPQPARIGEAPTLSSVRVRAGIYSTYDAMRDRYDREGDPTPATLGEGERVIMNVERSRFPGMLPAMDVAREISRVDPSVTRESVLGRLAPMATGGSGQAAEQDLGLVQYSPGQQPAINAARDIRRQRIGNIFLEIRRVVASQGTAPGPAAARLATLGAAFQGWLDAHLSPQLLAEPGTARTATVAFVRALVVFLTEIRRPPA